MNLEYLSLALQVRASEGREPLFSLDPKVSSLLDASGDKDGVQVKRFEPKWLAGTSVGEVLFQADYHLKELSMGECDQPVVGLMSCLDLDLSGEGEDKAWRAREWFIVEKADIFLSEGNTLTPFVKMGVEAREQFVGPTCLEDKKLTRPDHPLVKYANDFTHYFDLIAERRSSIYHLRELAKASVLAKFLVEEGFELDETWFNVAGQMEGGVGPMEIPQLWNERNHGKIHVKDGRIAQTRQGIQTNKHQVYGGVEFGLGALPRVALTSVASNYATDEGLLAAAMQSAEAELLGIRPTLIQARAPAAMSFSPAARLSVGAGAVLSGGRPAGVSGPLGVDLDLAGFDLSGPVKLSPAIGAKPAECGERFWSWLDGADAEERGVFGDLFNPHLSDRREEGEQFIPPCASFGYLDKLQGLLTEEAEMKRQRKAHFLSEVFDADEPGPLFPATWMPPLGIAHKAKGEVSLKRERPRHPTGSELANLECALQDGATPTFNKCAEDGTRFRMYQIGGVEVRTVQDHGGQEVIGVVVESAAHQSTLVEATAAAVVRESEYVVKVTEYVEAAPCKAETEASLPWRYFVVLETEAGGIVVVEKFEDGREVWQEGSDGLAARRALAKVVGCADCQGAEVTLRDALKSATRS